MHRLGMLIDHYADLAYEGGTFPAIVHAITADQWRSRGERPACMCATTGQTLGDQTGVHPA
jgi:hypothetical protein